MTTTSSIFRLVVFVVLGLGLPLWYIGFQSRYITLQELKYLFTVSTDNTNIKLPAHVKHSAACPNVLEMMMDGKIRPGKLTDGEENDIESFLRHAFFLSRGNRTYEKPDLSCGNVNYYGWRSDGANAKRFRVLCEPKGKTPCCLNNHCVARDVNECRCPKCFDLRSKVHGEAAEWIPEDTRCQVKNYTESSACDLLKGGTLHFYGDSLVRQMFSGLVSILNKTGLLRQGLSADNVSNCQSHYVLIRPCNGLIDKTPIVCGGQVKLEYTEIRDLKDVPLMLKTARPLMGRKKSLIFFGGGLWMNSKSKQTTQFATSLLKMLYKNGTSKGKWPKTVWSGLHAAGLQLMGNDGLNTFRRNVFNRRLKTVTAKYGVPIFDTMNITKDARSTDGHHYPLGINILKSQIFLNYIAELQRKYIW